MFCGSKLSNSRSGFWPAALLTLKNKCSPVLAAENFFYFSLHLWWVLQSRACRTQQTVLSSWRTWRRANVCFHWELCLRWKKAWQHCQRIFLYVYKYLKRSQCCLQIRAISICNCAGDEFYCSSNCAWEGLPPRGFSQTGKVCFVMWARLAFCVAHKNWTAYSHNQWPSGR